MRTPIIAGNWKMNKTVSESLELVNELKALVSGVTDVEVVVSPPFTSLYSVAQAIKDTNIILAGQNIHQEKSGAYTGEISGEMLLSVGCTHVIIGHSERREYFKETDELINGKIITALDVGLKVICCIGETLEQREAQNTMNVITTQLKGALIGITAEQMDSMILAYEPVWAIGTGRTATPAQAEEVHSHIRNLLVELYGSEIADKIVIQYGGSVKPDNAFELMSQPNIDGALVGGASLKADVFSKIVNFK